MSNEPSRCGETRRSTLNLEDKGSAQRLQHVEVRTSRPCECALNKPKCFSLKALIMRIHKEGLPARAGEGPFEQLKMPPNFNIVSSEREGTQ